MDVGEETVKYSIAEKFKSIQGEGVYAGTPMAFIRFVGCSVGKTVCSACDTDFEESIPWRGGGTFDERDLLAWASPYKHICLTGGEPLDQDLIELLHVTLDLTTGKFKPMIHIETSGTKDVRAWLDDTAQQFPREALWICVSPKPGFLEESVDVADEVKVIMPGLGALKHGNVQAPGWGKLAEIKTPSESILLRDRYWPTLEDALRWAASGKTVFLQPRNERNEVNWQNLRLCQDIIVEHPELRLSVQMHKILHVQ